MHFYKIDRIDTNIRFYALPLMFPLFLLFADELAIPGHVPEPIKVVIVLPDPPVRSPREINMDNILAKYKTGLKTIENQRLIDFIDEESRKYGFEPELILAVISTESSFYNWSVSKKGALGMMQIIPSTGRAMAKTNPVSWKGGKEGLFDPFINIRLGIQYLHSLTQKFPDLRTALTAYNYGPTRVKRWVRRGKKLPTQYANRILRLYESYLQTEIPPQNAT